MAFTTHLRRQHTLLSDRARAFSQRLDATTVAASAPELCVALAEFVDELDRHLSLEDDLLYPILSRHDDPCIRRVAGAFVGEMSGLRPALDVFSRTWTEAEIRRRPAVFCRDARELFAAMDDRIRRENRELYPLADVGAVVPAIEP